MKTVVKIGGSLLYKKNNELDTAKLLKLYKVFTKNLGKNLVFVLGCGSNLHKITNDFNLNSKGPLNIRIQGFERITKLTEDRFKLIRDKINVNVISALALFIKETKGNKRSHEISWYNEKAIKKMPIITMGGCTLDKNILFCTISSDTIAAYIAAYGTSKLIVATDTNGILDKSSNTIKSFKADDYEKFSYIKGGMRDKIRRLRYAVNKNVATYIVNGNNLLKGDFDTQFDEEHCTTLIK